MKLYATTTSERASKGQGGNKTLDIQLQVESNNRRENAGLLQVREEKKGFFRITFKQGGVFKTIAIIDLQEKS